MTKSNTEPSDEKLVFTPPSEGWYLIRYPDGTTETKLLPLSPKITIQQIARADYVNTAATSDPEPTQACQNAIKMAKTELLTELIGKAIELYSDGKATKHSGQVPVVPLEILERYRKELNE